MSDEIAVVLDATALSAYVAGQLSVGELIAEVADEDRRVGVPATCLVAAYAASRSEVGAALLTLLTTTSAIQVLPLGADLGASDLRQVGALARAAGGDVALGHAACAALTHQAHLATNDPVPAGDVLPAGWSILDLTNRVEHPRLNQGVAPGRIVGVRGPGFGVGVWGPGSPPAQGGQA